MQGIENLHERIEESGFTLATTRPDATALLVEVSVDLLDVVLSEVYIALPIVDMLEHGLDTVQDTYIPEQARKGFMLVMCERYTQPYHAAMLMCFVRSTDLRSLS